MKESGIQLLLVFLGGGRNEKEVNSKQTCLIRETERQRPRGFYFFIFIQRKNDFCCCFSLSLSRPSFSFYFFKNRMRDLRLRDKLLAIRCRLSNSSTCSYYYDYSDLVDLSIYCHRSSTPLIGLPVESRGEVDPSGIFFSVRYCYLFWAFLCTINKVCVYI